MSNPAERSVDVAEVLAEMDELGRAKWDVAVARWEAKQLRARVAELENGHASPRPEPSLNPGPPSD